MKSNITRKELEKIVHVAGRRQRLVVMPGQVAGTYIASTAQNPLDFAVAFVTTRRVGKAISRHWSVSVNVQSVKSRSEAARRARRFALLVKAQVGGRRIVR